MTSRRRSHATRGRATLNVAEQGHWSVFAGCDLSGGVAVHIHGSDVRVSDSARGRAGTVYRLDLERVLTTAREVGLVIVPHASGGTRAFVLAATPAVREWVEQGLQSDSPPWLVDNPPPADASPPVDQ
jgi:hypothetical protein